MVAYLSEVIIGYNSHFCFSLQLRGCNIMQIAIHNNGSGFRGGKNPKTKNNKKSPNQNPNKQKNSQEVRQQPQKEMEEKVHVTFIQVIQILPVRHIPFRLQSMWGCKTRKGMHPISLANMQPRLSESWGKEMRQGEIRYCSLKARA